MIEMNILITGACGGMGAAACKMLTEAGHTVWGLDIAEPKDAVPWNYIKTDITNEGSVMAAAARISSVGAQLDAIIHHAGMYDLNSLVEMGDKEVERIFEINLFSVARINRIFLPLLAKNARIIITSSELAPLDPLPFTGIYAITKTAIEKYAFSLRMELQLLGHRVIVLRPGAVRTSLLNVSMARLNDFCEKTELYGCNAERFRKIVSSFESRNVSPEKIAKTDKRILESLRPRYVYNVNRNILLRVFNLFPPAAQTRIIKAILKR